MFGIGMTEIVVILVIALLIFGPSKLPELARSLGKDFGEFRRASYDLRQSLAEAAEPDPPPQSQPAEPPKIHRDEADPKPVVAQSYADPRDPNPQGGA